MRRLRALGSLVTLVLFEGVAFLALRYLGSAEEWKVDWSHFGRWLDSTPQVDVLVGLARWAGLVGVGYLGFSTALYLLVALTRVPRLMRAAGILTFPGVRRLVEGSLAVGLMAGTALTRVGPAMAEPAGGWGVRAQATATATATAIPAATYVGAPPPAVAPTATEVGSWPVVKDDNLWSTAEEELAKATGRPVGTFRAAEILPVWGPLCDYMREQGRDPNLIYPGEVLTLPSWAGPEVPAVTTPAPLPPQPVASAAPMPVVPVPVAPSITEAPVPPTTVAEPVVASEQAPMMGAPVVDDGGPTTTIISTDEQHPVPVPVTNLSAGHSGLPLRIGGLGLLLAGVAGAMKWRRRVPEQQREPDEVIPPFDDERQEVELAVTAGADMVGAEFLELGLRALAGVVGDGDEDDPMPEPLGVILHEDRLDVVLGAEAPAPAPFVDHSDIWSLPRLLSSQDRAMLEEAGRGCPVPMPALVSLGTTDTSSVLLDIEEARLVAIDGKGAGEVVTAVGTELALPVWADVAAVVLVGFASPPTAPHVRAVDSLTDVLDGLEADARRIGALVAEAGCGSTFEARCLGTLPGDSIMPTIVVCASVPADDLARRLVDLVSTGEMLGVGALVAGSVEGALWQYHIEQEGLHIEQMGVTVQPHRLAPSEAEVIVDVVEASAALPVPAPLPSVFAPPPGGDDWPEVLIRVLGPIEVEGPSGPVTFERAKSKEALVALVVNRDRPIDSDRLVTMLWPRSNDVRASKVTLATTMSKMRYELGHEAGFSDDSHLYVPPMTGGATLYRVSPKVATDLALLQAAYRRSASLGEATARALLRKVLELVRGEPFDHVTLHYEWAAQSARDARTAVVDAAHRLVDLCLVAGDHETAWWATSQGLRAVPGNELMYRDQMRVNAARGNREGVEEVLQTALAVLDEDDLEPDPATTALHRRLLESVG